MADPKPAARRRTPAGSDSGSEPLLSGFETQKQPRMPQPPQLLEWSELPDWQKEDNSYVQTGYRVATPSFIRCLQSWGYLHNETGMTLRQRCWFSVTNMILNSQHLLPSAWRCSLLRTAKHSGLRIDCSIRDCKHGRSGRFWNIPVRRCRMLHLIGLIPYLDVSQRSRLQLRAPA